MPYTLLILYFLFFSFIGWIIDSISCSITQRRIVNSGYFRELPLCPLYGIGGLVLFFLMNFMQEFPPIVTIITTTAALNLVEYVGGVWCVLILKERLWDYSWRKWHLHGHIDLIHAFCWLILVSLSYYFLFPTAVQIDLSMQRMFLIPPILDQTTTVIFLLGSLYLTINRRTHRLRLAKKKNKKRHLR